MQSGSTRKQIRVAYKMCPIKKTLSNGLENVMSLSKSELRSILVELTFTFGVEIIGDDLIMNESNT